MKILNIDAFAQPKRELIIFGETYAVRDDSVQSYIDSLKMADELEANKDRTPVQQLELSIKAVMHAIPDLPVEAARKLNMTQLTMIMSFVRGEMDEKVAAPAGESASAGDKS